MPQGNIGNLKQRSTPEERIESARKAGLASGVARRKKRLMRDTIADFMTVEVPDQEIAAALEAAGFENSYENAVALAMLTRAAHGDCEAARFCRDTLGEKPSESFNFAMAQKERPIASLDLTQLSDEELLALADQFEEKAPALSV